MRLSAPRTSFGGLPHRPPAGTAGPGLRAGGSPAPSCGRCRDRPSGRVRGGALVGAAVRRSPGDPARRPSPVAQARDSALALLVPQVVADHHDATVPADHLALVADLLDAGLDLHLRSLSGAPLRARPTSGPGDRVAWRASGWTRADYLSR